MSQRHCQRRNCTIMHGVSPLLELSLTQGRTRDRVRRTNASFFESERAFIDFDDRPRLASALDRESMALKRAMIHDQGDVTLQVGIRHEAVLSPVGVECEPHFEKHAIVLRRTHSSEQKISRRSAVCTAGASSSGNAHSETSSSGNASFFLEGFNLAHFTHQNM